MIPKHFLLSEKTTECHVNYIFYNYSFCRYLYAQQCTTQTFNSFCQKSKQTHCSHTKTSFQHSTYSHNSVNLLCLPSVSPVCSVLFYFCLTHYCDLLILLWSLSAVSESNVDRELNFSSRLTRVVNYRNTLEWCTLKHCRDMKSDSHSLALRRWHLFHYKTQWYCNCKIIKCKCMPLKKM